ncbi:MAG: molybdopterin-dependent oxidoreductase [Candidatus Aminicenantales bacterium]
MVKLKINGQEVTAAPGSTVLEAAQANGIRIPNLCASKGLTPLGGCRLCLVEIKGKRGYFPACCTAVEEGLEVTTETQRLQALRRQTLELILSEHPHACLICSEKKDCEEYKSTIRKVGEVTGCVLCPKNGRCDLQDVVTELKIERVRWPASYRDFEVHREDPFFDRNYNLCILCARCVRMCSEVRGAAAISVVFRGPQAAISTSLDQPLLDSGCQFCGACVDVCPTGSLTERGLKGEGLPEDSRETVCPLCSIGCALEADLKKGRIVSTRPKEEAPVNRGQACVKGRFIVREAVHAPHRLLHPMVRRDGELVEVKWDDALDFAARRLEGEKDKGPVMVVSSQLSLEDLYVAQKFARQVLRTEPEIDLPYLSVPSLFRAELRKEKISYPLNFESRSLASARIIMIAGADIVHSHPILWLDVLKAVAQGARLLVWNSEAAAQSRRAAVSLRTKPGNELAALILLSRRLLEQQPEEARSAVPAWAELQPFPESAGRTIAGYPAEPEREAIDSAARLLNEAEPTVFLIGTGLVQGPDAPRLVRALWNLAFLCEARVIPLAVENNERGVLELWPSGSASGAFGARVIDGLEKGPRRALYLAGHLPGIGEEIVPETLIVQGCYQTGAGGMAQVLLPAVTWAETDGTFINVEGRIQRFKRLVDSPGEARQDWWIFCRLAEKMGSRDFPFQNPAEIAEDMSRAVPSLHEVSGHHLKRGRPAFVVEEDPSAARFIPLDSTERENEVSDGIGLSAPPPDTPDYYRGLDLRETSKGLRKLRERDKASSLKQEK